MLVVLLAWIIITFACWAWGEFVLDRMKLMLKDHSFPAPPFTVVCMAGLMVVTVLSGILSLVMPLGGWLAHLILVIPAFVILFTKRELNLFSILRNQLKSFHPALLFLLIASLVMILVMSTWYVSHPDTLTYHAQTIQWIEKYKAVPGLVHLHARYGYQGLWFVTEAFFNFRFAGMDTLTIINSVVVAWYVLFIVARINHNFLQGEPVNAVLWILLFAISCLSYTQVRLTITSASPDFIATLSTWLVFYLITRNENIASSVQCFLIIALSVFSVTLKLSAAPILLLAAYSLVYLLRIKKIKAAIVSLAIALVILSPFVARNIITTGYLLFPSVFPDVANVDWKLDKQRTRFEKNYITAYAKTPVDYDEQKVDEAMSLPVTDWIPAWWKNQRAADKVILGLLLLSIIGSFAVFRRIPKARPELKAAILTALAGIAFWFIQAPDPRFGFGFIIGLIALIVSIGLSRVRTTDSLRKAAILLILSSALVISGYVIYRGINFFSAIQLVKPLGIQYSEPVTFNCNEILFYKSKDNGPCADLPIPCIYSDSCNHFQLRGNKISDGFRAR